MHFLFKCVISALSSFISNASRAGLAAVLFLASTGLAQAQTGQIKGQLGGEAFQYSLSGEPMGFPGAMVDFASDGTTAELDVMMFALQAQGEQVKGAMVFLELDVEGDYQLEQLQPDMPLFLTFMLVEDWKQGEADPRNVWFVESDDATSMAIERLEMTEDQGIITGHLASDRFCLHDSGSGNMDPVLKGGQPVCKSGEIAFTVSMGDAEAMAAQPRPQTSTEVDVLGEIVGKVGNKSYQWMTILPRGATEGSATFSELSGTPAMITLQGYSPDAQKFLSQDVVTIGILSEHVDGFELDQPMDAEVTLMVDGSQLIYSAQDGDGHAQAIVRDLQIEGDLGRVVLEVRGTLCRVEQYKLVADDCLPFALQGKSEVLRESLQ